MLNLRLLALLAAGCAAHAIAAPELAPIFQDNGVLQCDRPVPVWGLASPGEHVTVDFAGQKVGSTADQDGHWVTILAPLAANPVGADLTVTGKVAVTVHAVLVGEVWLCSGDSGMEAALETCGPSEIATARLPLVRQFRVTRRATSAPAARDEWQACSPETAGRFTALGYFFARELFSRLGVPIGIINSSSSGSSLEQWMSPAALAPFPADTGASTGPGDPWAPSSLFNAMIEPLLPYAIRGTIWYQGEADVGRSADYAVRFPAMIKAWRAHFGEGDFPFFWVQLAGGDTAAGRPGEGRPRFREAQSAALALPATGQAVAMDVGDVGRREVGRRLALIAKATVYSIPVDFSGPVFSGSTVEGAAVRVSFNFAGEGLTASGKPLQSFEIAGADRVFHPAAATIQGDTVLVHTPLVRQPVAVRYAWRGLPEGNLYNGAGLPAPPFRSDDW
jgi:sialate O-acetylesterase